MELIRRFAMFLAVFIITTPAIAQPVGIGTTKSSANAQMGNIIAKVVSAHTDIQMRPQVMAGTQQYVEIMNAGELDFGLVNTYQLAMNYFGTHLSEGKKKPNLRIVATLAPFSTGLLVRRASGLKTIADLKGKRLTSGFSSAPLLRFFATAMLANAGLTWDDVQSVPIVGLRAGFDLLKTDQVDAIPAAVGAGNVKELDASIDGGVRFLSMNPDPKAVAEMLKYTPRTEVIPVKPSPKLVGIDDVTYVHGYEYLLVAHKDVSDALVTKVLKGLVAGADELKASSPIWRGFDSKLMAKDYQIPYHPAAITYYQQIGIWKQ